MHSFQVPPDIDGEEVAARLRELRDTMSILEMQRVSGVDRQVLYRLMGGTSINRTPYELVVKVMKFIVSTKTKAPYIKKELPVVTAPVVVPVVGSVEEEPELDPPPLLNISVLK